MERLAHIDRGSVEKDPPWRSSIQHDYPRIRSVTPRGSSSSISHGDSGTDAGTTSTNGTCELA